jgi:hypothetical protein
VSEGIVPKILPESFFWTRWPLNDWLKGIFVEGKWLLLLFVVLSITLVFFEFLESGRELISFLGWFYPKRLPFEELLSFDCVPLPTRGSTEPFLFWTSQAIPPYLVEIAVPMTSAPTNMSVGIGLKSGSVWFLFSLSASTFLI